MQSKCIWIVGQYEQTVFSQPLLWLHEGASCRSFANVESACCAVNSAQPAPHAIVLLQSRPGEFDSTSALRLHAAAPLARIVALCGPWCEGESRGSYVALAGVIHVPWRSWRGRLKRALGLSTEGPSLPRTASPAERLDASLAVASAAGQFDALAIVCSESRMRYEALRDALRLVGVRATWQWPAAPLDVAQSDLVFIDGWESWPAAWYPAGAALERPPLLLLLDFPRPQDHEQAQALGAKAVLAQPLLLEDLVEALQAVLGNTVAGRQQASALADR